MRPKIADDSKSTASTVNKKENARLREPLSLPQPHFYLFFLFTAKNTGISITKNTSSTTLHNEQQGSSNARFNVETTSINGFQASKNELDIAMLQILDPHLRPVKPAPNEPSSQKIYSEHMDLAQEYFKVGSQVSNQIDFKAFSILDSISDHDQLRANHVMSRIFLIKFLFYSTESNRNSLSYQTQRELASGNVTR
jgi:hypothetical protein